MSVSRKRFHAAAVLAGAAVITLCGTGSASAATGPSGTPTAADTAAISALAGGQGTVERLASTKFPGAHAASAAAPAADARTQVAVYEPTAGFVTGRSDVPASLAYVALPARTGDGSVATVWAERDARGWSVVNVASGDDESRYAKAAGSGYVLHEPQINAWYAVDGDTVTVLHGRGTGHADGTKLDLASYRAELRARYADKLPGSAYDRAGAGGGYGGAAAPASDEEAPVLPLVLGGVVLLAAGGVALPRLRRQ